MAANNPQCCGLDTSVVLRLLIGKPENQALAAKKLIEDAARDGRAIMISDLVVAESYFALHFHYRVPKNEALRSLLELIESGVVRGQENGVAASAIKSTLAASNKIGFLDRMIHAQYRMMPAIMASFEKPATRLEGTEVLTG